MILNWPRVEPIILLYNVSCGQVCQPSSPVHHLTAYTKGHDFYGISVVWFTAALQSEAPKNYMYARVPANYYYDMEHLESGSGWTEQIGGKGHYPTLLLRTASLLQGRS